MKEPKTPIDQLVLKLSEITLKFPKKHNSLIALVQQQLLLLRTLHIEMLKNDLHEAVKSIPQEDCKVSFKELVFNKIDTNKAILNYLSFLSVLNQFGRILGKKHSEKLSKFPNYYRIRFYRNKVGEHWDDYISIIGKRGLTFTKGKAAIPMVEEVLAPINREKVRKQLNFLFIKSGVKKLSIPKKYATTGAVSSKGDYPNFMYERLEIIDKKLRKDKIPDEIVTLLFQFGFPAPICNVEEYLPRLSDYLMNLLDLE